MEKRNKFNSLHFFLILSILLNGLFCLPVTAWAETKKADAYVLKEISVKVDENIISTYKYSYTKQGLVKKCVTDLGFYRYDYQNQLLNEITFVPDSGYNDLNKESTQYHYDKKNRIKNTVRKVFFEADNSKLMTKTVYEYDKDNRLAKQYVSQDGEPISWTYAFQYNEDGKVSQLKYDVPDEDLNVKIKYTYDQYGNEKKESITTTLNGKKSKTMLKYKYSIKNGRIYQKEETYSSSDKDSTPVKTVYEYSYKKIKIPKSYRSLMETQQETLENKHVVL